MPRYTATDPETGRSITLEGDSPPTEEELVHIFSSSPELAGVAQHPPQEAARSLAETGVEIVKQGALPLIGTALLGPGGGFAGTFAAQELGLAPKSSLDLVLSELPYRTAKAGQSTKRGWQSVRAAAHPSIRDALREEAATKGPSLLAPEYPAAQGKPSAEALYTQLRARPDYQTPGQVALPQSQTYAQEIRREASVLRQQGPLGDTLANAREKVAALADQAKSPEGMQLSTKIINEHLKRPEMLEPGYEHTLREMRSALLNDAETAAAYGDAAMVNLLEANKTYKLEAALDDLQDLYNKTISHTGGIRGENVDRFLTQAEALRAKNEYIQSALPLPDWERIMNQFKQLAAEEYVYKSQVGSLALPGTMAQTGGGAGAALGYAVGGPFGAAAGGAAGGLGAMERYAAKVRGQKRMAATSPEYRANLLEKLRGTAPQKPASRVAAGLQVPTQTLLYLLNRGQQIPGLPVPPPEETQ